MDFLTKERLSKWRSVLPDDIAAIMEEPKDIDAAFADVLKKRLPTINSAESALDFAGENAEKFIELGRIGRLRFIAWVLAKKYDDVEEFQKSLVVDREVDENGDESSGGGSSSGTDKIAPFFYSDILAFAEALGPRVAAQIVDRETLDIVAGASADLGQEFEMKRGI